MNTEIGKRFLLLAEAAAKEAVMAERERCAAIVQLARHGEIDGDLRCIIARIEDGDTIAAIKAE